MYGSLVSKNNNHEEALQHQTKEVTMSHQIKLTKLNWTRSANSSMLYQRTKGTTVERKYCEVEDKPVSYTIFYKLFSEPNIAIKNPKKDRCHTCDELKKLMYAGNDEQISLKQQQDMHHSVAELAYQFKIADENWFKTDSSMTVLAFDLQQCLLTPSLQTSVAFYKRKLWTFNLTVHNMKANQATDSCPGQNKNTPFLAMYLYFVQEKKIDILYHKFMVPGHSRMKCDSDHAVIEEAKKYSTQISHPHDWAQLIRMAGKKRPFNVIELTQEDFCDYASLLRTNMSSS
ncbi:hypothetical protein PR048_022350 [Dryococelus australis]|uniref:Uncharacterized protein n=1 Tax=Dryococelus australis TaxID=614101 RepID=A0ABQ9H0R2_9NEOP|nr:hypothetical protein PR048_022350 [Dryococelus australis]